ncbi:hypothetical protein AC579_1167 [Pseudocercospora musae]|uniref:Uncharacterized protein n=1 Tax=Pseudocercospora musae TaxID=113226 RepID=A0A139H5K5_9PEZI|nr:hypothetical protein AC579_1167 [Pseudocercospora musae]
MSQTDDSKHSFDSFGDNFTGSRDIPITDIYHETTLLAACEKVNDVQTSRGIFGRRFIMQWSNRDGPTGAKIVMHQSDAETDRYDVIAKIQCENVGHEVVKEMRDLGLLAEEDSDDQ